MKASNQTVAKSNLVGDGLTFGGLLVVRPDGKVQYAFQARPSCACYAACRAHCRTAPQEETFGDHAPPEDVLDAALKAAAK